MCPIDLYSHDPPARRASASPCTLYNRAYSHHILRCKSKSSQNRMETFFGASTIIPSGKKKELPKGKGKGKAAAKAKGIGKKR